MVIIMLNYYMNMTPLHNSKQADNRQLCKVTSLSSLNKGWDVSVERGLMCVMLMHIHVPRVSVSSV